jgi:hypothetical protein
VVAQAALVSAFLPHRPPPDRPRSALGNIYRTSDDRWLQLTVVREDKMNAHGRKTSHYGMAIRGVSVSNEVLGCLIPGEGFGYLAGDPIRRRIGGDVDPQQVASLQADDGQSIEKPEANGRHDEQVDSTDVRHMIVEKGLPALGRWPRRRTVYLATVDCATLKPSLSSSPWMRGAPHSGFARLISPTRARNSAKTFDLPTRLRDRQRQ